jgi:hypothetical protein
MDQREEMLSKRFQTTMIGALYQFEEHFGYLWGFDKEDKNLTESEKRFRIMWEDVRYNILNNGNHQLRSAVKDLQNLKMDNFKYHYNLHNRPFK